MSMLKEFKDFALKGSVVDMAVGVIIGGAFGKIVASLVNDVFMPAIGFMTGKVDFSALAITLKEKSPDAEAVVIKYGVFLNTVIQFVIVAFVIFLVIKQMNRFKKTETPAAPTTKTCPYCCSEIPLGAVRCPHCTAELKA